MRHMSFAALLVASALAPAHADFTVLYAQDFESPTGFVNDSGDVNIFRTINQLYSNQPPGFVFAQTNTVETLRVGGTQAWNVGFQDPQTRAGSYALGMLSSVENDFLGLAFDIGTYDYLNFRLDISSIDLDRWGGPFVPTGGAAPVFRFSLFDNPGGLPGIGSGSPLSFVDLSGTVAPNKFTFDWTNVVAGLSTTGNTNGRVILRIGLLTGGYASVDNFVIAASNNVGEVPTIPEPQTWALLLAGLATATAFAKRKARR